jgi:hypothetical protein
VTEGRPAAGAAALLAVFPSNSLNAAHGKDRKAAPTSAAMAAEMTQQHGNMLRQHVSQSQMQTQLPARRRHVENHTTTNLQQSVWNNNQSLTQTKPAHKTAESPSGPYY